MLTDIAPFFNKMFTGCGVPFLVLDAGTLGVGSLISYPSPAISRI
jgi:hypothetical protein